MSPIALTCLITALCLGLGSSLVVNFKYYSNEADQVAAVEELATVKEELETIRALLQKRQSKDELRKKNWQEKAGTTNSTSNINNGKNYNKTQF